MERSKPISPLMAQILAELETADRLSTADLMERLGKTAPQLRLSLLRLCGMQRIVCIKIKSDRRRYYYQLNPAVSQPSASPLPHGDRSEPS